MGDLNVKVVNTQKQLNDFTKHLLKDVQGLDEMLKNDWFETGQMKIGAEQEICLIDPHYKPANKAMEVLSALNNDSFTTELAKFNVEANLSPQDFKGECFSLLENEIKDLLGKLRKVTDDLDIDFLMTGILPTLRKFDLGIENITPLPRYHALMKAITKLRGKIYELRIKGIDELNIKQDSAMLEACNTSFQVHLQVTPDEFVQKYNAAQLLTAPTVAISSNSPMLFGKRLWHETRVALFQQSVDTRITSEHLRDRSPRVTFGNQWLKDSVLEIYKEDIVRFRIMLMANIEEDCLAQIEKGITPSLRALMVHNSTVYRWNRPCYGISPNGRPHLRIENRVLPAGPSVIDEVANAAFWLGMMNGISDHYPDVTKLMDFDDAKANFHATAFNGLQSKLKWTGGQKIGVNELIKKELIPLAKEGLQKNNINKADIDRYIAVIEERNENNQNGTNWFLKSYSNLAKDANKEEISLALTASIVKYQREDVPVHKWDLATIDDILKWHPASILVEEFMTTDLFTVNKLDILELVADMMDWQHIRFTPVEDDKGKLIGLVSMRMILRHINKHRTEVPGKTTVQDIMIKNPLCISPDSTIFDAMNLMKENKIGCLPVIKNKKLVGIVTEGNFLNITSTLLKIINKGGL